jgi:hypothetical protein
VVVELGSGALALQDSELVAKHDDLEVLGAARAYGQACQRRQEPVEDTKHENTACSVSALVSALDRDSGTHTLDRILASSVRDR